MSNINLTVRPAMTAADWAAQNPLIYQFEKGRESDTRKEKTNWDPTPTHWNDLQYDNPGDGSPGGSADWGDIGGDIEDQTDLQAALDSKPTGTPAEVVAEGILYSANLTQAGTDPPTASQVTGSAGDVPWTYQAVGIYQTNSGGAFAGAKCFLSTTSLIGDTNTFRSFALSLAEGELLLSSKSSPIVPVATESLGVFVNVIGEPVPSDDLLTAISILVIAAGT